jgi:predicted aldo/keto reductase-like oxidoreductase
LIDSDRFDAMLVNYSLLNASAWSLEQAPGSAPDYSGVGASAAARGIGLVALRVLEGGRLTRTVPEAVVANGTRAAQAADASSLAIRFVLSNPQIATALIGFSDVEQIDAAVRAASLGPLEEGMLAAGMRQRR